MQDLVVDMTKQLESMDTLLQRGTGKLWVGHNVTGEMVWGFDDPESEIGVERVLTQTEIEAGITLEEEPERSLQTPLETPPQTDSISQESARPIQTTQANIPAAKAGDEAQIERTPMTLGHERSASRSRHPLLENDPLPPPPRHPVVG